MNSLAVSYVSFVLHYVYDRASSTCCCDVYTDKLILCFSDMLKPVCLPYTCAYTCMLMRAFAVLANACANADIDAGIDIMLNLMLIPLINIKSY